MSNYNTQPAGLEKWLDEMINKKSSVQLPAGGKKWLGENVWWLALIGGVLNLWGAWSFWRLGHSANELLEGLGRYYGNTLYTQELDVWWYLVLAAMVGQGVLLLMAFQKLKEGKKTGWNLLFYGSLLSIVMGVLYLFVPGYGGGSLVGTAIGTLIGWFLLFQMRSHFAK